MENLTLNNGQIANFVGEDYWGRPLYQLENGTTVCCPNLNGTHLHTLTPENGEPDCPLKEEYQPRAGEA